MAIGEFFTDFQARRPAFPRRENVVRPLAHENIQCLESVGGFTTIMPRPRGTGASGAYVLVIVADQNWHDGEVVLCLTDLWRVTLLVVVVGYHHWNLAPSADEGLRSIESHFIPMVGAQQQQGRHQRAPCRPIRWH